MPLRADGEAGGPQVHRPRRWWLVGFVALAALVVLISALVVLPIGIPIREEFGSYRVCGVWGTDAALRPSRGSTYTWEYGAAVYARPGAHSVILPARSGYADREWSLRLGRLRWAIIHYPDE